MIPLLRHITRSISERFRDNGLIIKYNINLSLFFYFFTIFVNWLLIIIIIIIVHYSLHTHPMGIPTHIHDSPADSAMDESIYSMR